MKKRFPFLKQQDQMDCAATCLFMLSKYFGKHHSLQKLRKLCQVGRTGTSLLSISEAAEKIGFKTLSARVDLHALTEELPLPLIAYWTQSHFVIVFKITKSYIYIADPSYGIIKYNHSEFLRLWSGNSELNQQGTGLVLILEPTSAFLENPVEQDISSNGLAEFFKYIVPYKKIIYQVIIGLLINTILTFILPFLTQSVVDVGINNQNIKFVNIILIAQVTLFASQFLINGIRSWIFLHIGSRVSITIISEFISKMMRLPMSFFDSKRIGDILQRVKDNGRIQTFLTTTMINMVFGIVNFVVFSSVLFFYSFKILTIFLLGSFLYFGWILIFQRKRKELDYRMFSQMSDNQSNLIQLIEGAQEIKQQNCEIEKRWQWERMQSKQYKLGMITLKIDQLQQMGSFFIDQLKNIFITYFVAKAVIDGDMTLGMMISVQYIVGQLNTPLAQAMTFIHDYQDARISLERLEDIRNNIDEEDIASSGIQPSLQNKDIVLNNLSFSYGSESSKYAISNLFCKIPSGKTTAVVGMSGSGKTTIIKLLLKFYLPSDGEIKIGEHNLTNISPKYWREHCGAVLQDGYIFSDTIAKNIALSDEIVDENRLLDSLNLACLSDYISSLPLGYNTKIGQTGQGVSQGQKQRILLARAFYNHPEFLFFDEATNSLDTKNESTIMSNIYHAFKDKTIVIVAHRLSTVRNADQILVMENGKILEQGKHEDLIKNRSLYFSLVSDQLALN